MSRMVDLAHATGREDHDRRGERLDLAGLRVQDVEAQRAVAWTAQGHRRVDLGGRQEVDREVVLKHPDVRSGGHRAQQGRFDRPTRHVAGMEDPAVRVAAFASEVRPSVGPVLEPHAPGDEFGDPRGAALYDMADGGEVAEPVARGHGVLYVAGEVVGLVGDTGDPALGPVRVGFRAGLLGDDGDGTTASGQVEREAQAADAATNHDCV